MMKKTNGISGKTLLGIVHLIGVLLLAGCATPEVYTPPPKPVFPSAPEEPRFYYERTIYSSADVAKGRENSALRQMLTGENSTSAEGMGKPYGLAVFHGRVFVSDASAHAVVVFDIPGQRYYKIGEDGEGTLISPMGLDVDSNGNLYVVDSSAKVVQVYGNDGKFLRTLGSKDKFVKPVGVAVDAEGSKIYVVDIGTVMDDKHRVRVFDAKNGEHLFDIGKRGSGDGEFNLPRDVTIGGSGLLYVVDGGNFRVQVFKPDGTFVRSFGSIGRQSGQFSRPKEAAADADGNIYVIDSAFGNFQIFNPEGELLLVVGGRSNTDQMAKYQLPSGIAIDGDGRVYVVDQVFRKVDVYRPASLAAEAGFVVKPELASKK